MRWFLCLVLASPAGSLAAGLAPSPERPAIDPDPVAPLHVEIPEAEEEESGLSLTPELPFHWCRDAADARPLRIRAAVDGSRFDHGLLTVWNWRNEPIQRVRIEGGRSALLAFRIEGLGSYLLTLDGFSAGTQTARKIRNIARVADLNEARDAFRPDDFFLGICAFPGRYHWTVGGEPAVPSGLSERAARELEAALLARLGFQVVRIDESMEMGRSGESGDEIDYTFDFSRMDAAADAYLSRGFDLALQLMHAPDWAIHPHYDSATEHRWRFPREESAQRAYARALLDRYGTNARFVQVFNEPDQIEFWSGTPDEFLTHHRSMHEVIRAFDPDVPVANGGYAFVDETRVRHFAHHLRETIDRPSYHSHGTLENLRDAFTRMTRVHDEAGYHDPVYLNTETGFDAWRLDQEKRQAEAVLQKVLYCWANGHRGVMLFCGRMVKGPGRSDRDLGLLDYQFCPRFSYASVGGLVAALAGARHEEKLRETDTEFVYRFRRDDETILAFFSLTPGKVLPLRYEARGARLLDAMGNATPLAPAGETEFAMSAYPAYLVLDSARQLSRTPSP